MVSFFLWIEARDGILAIDNLVKRGQSLVNWCCMCPLLIGVACVGVMGKLWTISYFIVSWLKLFGVKFSSVWSPLGNAKDGYISSFC